MRKFRKLSLVLVLSFVLLMAAGCSCGTDTTVDENGTTKDQGMVEDIGDDIQDGINDIENDLDGNAPTDNRGTTNNNNSNNNNNNNNNNETTTRNNGTTNNNSSNGSR